jgi:hypothetical protein
MPRIGKRMCSSNDKPSANETMKTGKKTIANHSRNRKSNLRKREVSNQIKPIILLLVGKFHNGTIFVSFEV